MISSKTPWWISLLLALFLVTNVVCLLNDLLYFPLVSGGVLVAYLAITNLPWFFAAMAFATSLGWGVAVSALPVGIYQAGWTVIGLFLGQILDGYQVDAMTIVGGIMLICIALRLLNIKNVAVGNLLPALAIAPVLALLVQAF